MCRADVQGAVVTPPGAKVSGSESYDADVLAPEDAWIANFDAEAFKEDVRVLGKELADQQGPADVVCASSTPRRGATMLARAAARLRACSRRCRAPARTVHAM